MLLGRSLECICLTQDLFKMFIFICLKGRLTESKHWVTPWLQQWEAGLKAEPRYSDMECGHLQWDVSEQLCQTPASQSRFQIKFIIKQQIHLKSLETLAHYFITFSAIFFLCVYWNFVFSFQGICCYDHLFSWGRFICSFIHIKKKGLCHGQWWCHIWAVSSCCTSHLAAC